MPYILILLLSFCLQGCFCHRPSDKKKSELVGIIPLPERVETSFAYETRLFSKDHADTMLVYIYGERMRMTPEGKVLDRKGNLFLDFAFSTPQKELYFYQRDHDMFLFYTSRKEDKSFCVIKCIDLKSKEEVWSVELEGFAFSRPVIRGQFAYISTVGFIGKMKLKNGFFDWRLSDMHKKGKYNRFREPEFLGANQIQFVSPHPFSLQNDTIVVNDITGEIIRMN